MGVNKAALRKSNRPAKDDRFLISFVKLFLAEPGCKASQGWVVSRLPLYMAPLFLLFLAPTLLTACGDNAINSSGSPLALRKPYEDKVLRINLGTEPPGLDWHTSTDSTSFDVVSNLMVGLTQYTNDLEVKPSCAASWDVLDGGRRYLFHLRDGVTWTDGKPVTAYDFEFAWRRLLKPETAAQYAFFLYDIEGARDFNTGKIRDFSKVGLKAIDAKTFEVKLSKPAAYFIYLTAFCPTFPQRKDIVEQFGDRWTEPEHLVTNGPFKLAKWQHEYKIELDANEKFFEGRPALSKIKMFMVPEASTAFALYENNELDFVDNRSFSTPDVERYRSSPEYRNFPLLRAYYLAFNVSKKPFDDVRVRKAFAMAINRNVFPKILRRGERPTNSWIPPALGGDGCGLSFDVAAARRLLSEAGFPGGKGFPETKLLYPNREDVRLVVEATQDELKRNLGVKIDLVNQEWKVYLATTRKDPPQMFRDSWGADFPDPETFMNLFTTFNGNNHTRWHSQDYDNLIEQAEGEQDKEKRKALYQKADVMLCRDAVPIVPAYLATQNIMVKPWVKGIAVNPLDFQFFKTVEVGESNK